MQSNRIVTYRFQPKNIESVLDTVNVYYDDGSLENSFNNSKKLKQLPNKSRLIDIPYFTKKHNILFVYYNFN